MPTHPRKDLVLEGKIATYHVWSRCVQGAHLGGIDPITGRDLSHRKDCNEKLLLYQAEVFAIDVGNYHILDNHQHGVFRTRPDVTTDWSDEELAWRWRMAWPQWDKTKREWVCMPTDQEIKKSLQKGTDHLDRIRECLSDLSWFVARWKQPYAWYCNRDVLPEQTERRGHCFEQRYGCRRLESDGEIYASFLYNDLQAYRAGMVDFVGDSKHSAIARQMKLYAIESWEQFLRGDKHNQFNLDLDQVLKLYEGVSLSPITSSGPLITGAVTLTLPPSGEAAGEQPTSGLILPEGYKDESAPQSEPDATTAESETGDAEEPTGQDESVESGGDQPGGRKATYEITKRYRARQRSRASDNAVLAMPPEQYFQMLAKAEERIRQLRASRMEADAAERELIDVLPMDGVVGGRVAPNATPSTWQAEKKQFEAWLAQYVLNRDREVEGEEAEGSIHPPRSDPSDSGPNV